MVQSVPTDLGECISRDVKLLDKLGWHGIVAHPRPTGDFSSLSNVNHPARRLLKLYKYRGAPVKFATPPWTRQQIIRALHRGLHKSCHDHIAHCLSSRGIQGHDVKGAMVGIAILCSKGSPRPSTVSSWGCSSGDPDGSAITVGGVSMPILYHWLPRNQCNLATPLVVFYRVITGVITLILPGTSNLGQS